MNLIVYGRYGNKQMSHNNGGWAHICGHLFSFLHTGPLFLLLRRLPPVKLFHQLNLIICHKCVWWKNLFSSGKNVHTIKQVRSWSVLLHCGLLDSGIWRWYIIVHRQYTVLCVHLVFCTVYLAYCTVHRWKNGARTTGSSSRPPLIEGVVQCRKFFSK